MAKLTGRPTGRPPKYSKELACNICAAIVEGKSLRKISKELDFSLQSFFRWLDEHNGFSEQYAKAKQQQSELFIEEMMDIAENEPDVQRAKLKVDTRKWVASKLKPKKYGEFQRQQISGDKENPLHVVGLSDGEILARIGELIDQ